MRTTVLSAETATSGKETSALISTAGVLLVFVDGSVGIAAVGLTGVCVTGGESSAGNWQDIIAIANRSNHILGILFMNLLVYQNL